MRGIVRVGLAFVWLIGLPGAAGGQELGPGVAEIRACVERNVPVSGRQEIELTRVDRGGNARTLSATAHWKRDGENRVRLLVRVQAPADVRGAAFLFVGSQRRGDVWSYLPELRTVRRVTGRAVSGSFFATDFTYEDVVELQGASVHARIERLADGELDGRPVYALEASSPEGSDSAYRRVVSFVDRETCVVLAADLYGASGERVKELRVAWPDVEQQGRYWRARRISMRNLEQGSESQLVFAAADWDVELPDRLFQQSELPRQQ